MSAVVQIDGATGEIVSRENTLPALPDNPGTWSAERLATACREVYEHRDDIVGSLDLDDAVEMLSRAGAIEKYVRSKEHKDATIRAARVLETAVGAALGLAYEKLPCEVTQIVGHQDRARFRLMHRYREVWWPKLVEQSLSRKQVLRLIDFARDRRAPGEGAATIDHAEATAWLRDVESADLLLTDPPYSTDVEDVGQFALAWLPLALSKLKPSGRALVFIGAYAEEIAAYFSIPLPDGWRWGTPHAWAYRNTIGPTPDRDFIRNWQCILSIRGPEAPPLQSDRITDLLAGFIENAPDGRQAIKHHRWEKPLELVQRLIRVTTKFDDLVIDPFAGSGTTLIAAKAVGRIGLGCEIDSGNVAIAIERGCNAA